MCTCTVTEILRVDSNGPLHLHNYIVTGTLHVHSNGDIVCIHIVMGPLILVVTGTLHIKWKRCMWSGLRNYHMYIVTGTQAHYVYMPIL